MTAQDYKITTDYGYVPGYPLNNGFHKGQDRAMPIGTPVMVNNQLIGLSGNTGESTGPHLHLGRFINGKDTDPDGRGFELDSPIVDSVGSDATNGNYIRLKDSAGVIWVYLHLSEIKVTKGQKIGVPMWNDGDITNAKRFETGVPDYQPSGGELDYYKQPEHQKDLLYDTIKGGQVQIDIAKAGGSKPEPLPKGIYEVK